MRARHPIRGIKRSKEDLRQFHRLLHQNIILPTTDIKRRQQPSQMSYRRLEKINHAPFCIRKIDIPQFHQRDLEFFFQAHDPQCIQGINHGSSPAAKRRLETAF
jgi:hypothetical protein